MSSGNRANARGQKRARMNDKCSVLEMVATSPRPEKIPEFSEGLVPRAYSRVPFYLCHSTYGEMFMSI